MNINGDWLEEAVKMSLFTGAWWGESLPDSGLAKFTREKVTAENLKEFRQAVQNAIAWLGPASISTYPENGRVSVAITLSTEPAKTITTIL